MGIRLTVRDNPRLATLLVGLIGLGLVAAVALVLAGGGGGDGDSGPSAAELEAEEIEKFEKEAAAAETSTTQTTQRQRPTTTRRPTTTTSSSTTVPPSTAPNPDGPDDPNDPEPGDDPIGEVTTTQPAGDSDGPGSESDSRIIRELTAPVPVYVGPGLDAEVVGELGIAAPVSIQERKDGWYRIESGDVVGWVFGAFVVPSPDPDFQSLISVDGSALRPQYADGELVPDPYRPGKYGFGFVQPDGDRTLIFLPDGLVVYIPSNQVRPVQ